MKIYYINDDKVSIRIKVIGKDFYDDSVILQPREGRIFEFPTPENAIAFVKHWHYNVVLLSYAEDNNT
jgi:hypothetical protein